LLSDEWCGVIKHRHRIEISKNPGIQAEETETGRSKNVLGELNDMNFQS